MEHKTPYHNFDNYQKVKEYERHQELKLIKNINELNLIKDLTYSTVSKLTQRCL